MQNLLPCGCVIHDPSRGMCNEAFNLYDVMRKSLEIYETERDFTAIILTHADGSYTPYQQEQICKSQQAYQAWLDARKDFRDHYKIFN